MFISFDGIDGSGKSTQIRLLADYFRSQGKLVETFRDPGGTQLGEALRDILLHRAEIPLTSVSEMLLYMASRAQLVSEQLRPALQRSDVIICDRFLLANVVYQSCAGGLLVEDIWQVGTVATGGLRPDLTILLDLPVELALRRIDRGLDRLESRGPDYFGRVRQVYLEQIGRASKKYSVVNAARDPESIHREVVDVVAAL